MENKLRLTGVIFLWIEIYSKLNWQENRYLIVSYTNYARRMPIETTEQESNSNSENIRENGIGTATVVRNFTHRLDVVIDQKKKERHLEHSLCFFVFS